MKVVVTGATGFVGSALVPALVARGDDVRVLSRDAARATAKLGVPAIAADLESRGAWGDALAGTDAVVHLAGEPVAAKRWTARQKQVIRDSRVEATRTLVESIAALPPDARPRTLVSASGTDYYAYAAPPLDDDEVTEADPAADTFLGRVCRDWEKEARAAEALGLRVACLRTGFVIGTGGGPLAELTKPFRFLAGGKLGNGKQWVSWIHLDDVVGVMLAATADARYTGAINLVTDSIRNKEFAAAVGRAMHRPSWLPAPGFALHAVVGEFAEVILNGRRVVPKRLRELGFTWKYADVDRALAASV